MFEILMLLCFASAWPFSLHKSWTSRTNGGKSLLYMVVVACGYLFGATHKTLNDHDWVVYLYIFGAVMVICDMALYNRNHRLNNQDKPEKYHWHLICFGFENQFHGGYSSGWTPVTISGHYKNISKARINSAKEAADELNGKATRRDALTVSYLGYMTAEEFNGTNEEGARTEEIRTP